MPAPRQRAAGGRGRVRAQEPRAARHVRRQLKCFSIEITKNYRLTEFREDLKELFRQAGVSDKPTVFLFDETQIVVETFLEDINNVLTSGEVPNLFAKDEISGLCEDVRADAKRAGVGEMQDELYRVFLGRVIKNLHIVLCMSPIGDELPVPHIPRARQLLHHRLVHGVALQTLQQVAKKQMESEKEMDDEVKESLCKVFATCHRSTAEKSGEMLAATQSAKTTSPRRITWSLSAGTERF